MEKSKTCWGGGHKGKNFDQIISLENLFAAWKEFLRGKSSRPDVAMFAVRLEDNLFALHDALHNGTWMHGLYQKFQVCDPKLRVIHKTSVSDRIVHHAIVRAIEPIFDRSFIFDSWSCRLGKGTHRAVIRCQRLLSALSRNNTQQVWILQGDIKKYFENIDHDILLKEISKKIQDAKALDLIYKIVKSFNPGLPLGNLTSQLFANIYLNPFDHFIKEILRAPVYLRYCDDFLLAHESRNHLIRQLSEIQEFLTNKLKLKLHPNKIKLRPFHWGIDWLGYIIFPRSMILRPTTRRRLWTRVNLKVNDYLQGKCSWDSLSSILASYHGALKHSWNNHDRKLLCQILKCL